MQYNVGVNQGTIRAILIYARPLTSSQPCVTLALITGAFLVNGLLLALSAGILCYWGDCLTFTWYTGSYGISCNSPAKENRSFKCCFLLYLKIHFLLVCGKRRKNDSSLIIESLLLIFAIRSLGLLLPSHSAITSYK